MKIRFLKECFPDVIESYDEKTEELETGRELFRVGDIEDVDVFGETPISVDVQFGDGSCIYGLARALFEFLPPVDERCSRHTVQE